MLFHSQLTSIVSPGLRIIGVFGSIRFSGGWNAYEGSQSRSNSVTWLLNCCTAAAVLPGISDATLIVTVFAERAGPAAALETKPAHTSRLAAATVVATRVDFIVTPFP